MRKLFCTVLCLLAAPLHAQQVGTIDTWQANARNVDWSEPSRTFANGAIRLILLDTVEPGAAAYHLMVTFPDVEGQYLDCRLISAVDGLGFASLAPSRALAKYDATRGLTVTVPGLTVEGDAILLTFTVNRATGRLTLP